MTVYVIGTVLSMICSYISCNLKSGTSLKYEGTIGREGFKILSTFFAFLSFIPLTAIMAFRYDVGTDFLPYQDIYLYSTREIEPGFDLLNKILRSFSNDPELFFLVSSVWICGCYYISVYRFSVSPVYSILLFVTLSDYFIAMNGIRQYMAIGVTMFAIPYIVERKFFKTLIIVLAAMTIHKSAIVFLIVYFIYEIPIKPVAVGLSFTLLYFLAPMILQLVMPLLNRFGFYIHFFSVTSIYRNQGFGLALAMLLIYLSFFLFLSFEYRSISVDNDLRLLYSAVVSGLFLVSISAVMPTTYSRLLWYCNAFIILFVPRAVKAIPNRKYRYAIGTAIIFCCTAQMIYTIVIKGSHEVLPYQSVFMK